MTRKKGRAEKAEADNKVLRDGFKSQTEYLRKVEAERDALRARVEKAERSDAENERRKQWLFGEVERLTKAIEAERAHSREADGVSSLLRADLKEAREKILWLVVHDLNHGCNPEERWRKEASR